MDQATYDTIPALLLLRELQFEVTQPGRRTTVITIVTTLTDATISTKADLAELYGIPLECRTRYSRDPAEPEPQPPALQVAQDGAARIMGDAAGL